MSENNFKDKPVMGKKCRIKPIFGIKSFAECLEPNTQICSHAQHFGNTILCYHPEWQQKMIPEDAENRIES